MFKYLFLLSVALYFLLPVANAQEVETKVVEINNKKWLVTIEPGKEPMFKSLEPTRKKVTKLPFVINGKPERIGEVMSSHKYVSKITFTGSTRVGKYLMNQASETIKSISLELGGNAPFIVFNDCDLEKAVNGLIDSKFRNAGQTCISANRIFVHEDISKDFLQKLKEKIVNFKVGNGLDNSDIGPMISEKAVEKIVDSNNFFLVEPKLIIDFNANL